MGVTRPAGASAPPRRRFDEPELSAITTAATAADEQPGSDPHLAAHPAHRPFSPSDARLRRRSVAVDARRDRPSRCSVPLHRAVAGRPAATGTGASASGLDPGPAVQQLELVGGVGARLPRPKRGVERRHDEQARAGSRSPGRRARRPPSAARARSRPGRRGRGTAGTRSRSTTARDQDRAQALAARRGGPAPGPNGSRLVLLQLVEVARPARRRCARRSPARPASRPARPARTRRRR